jgi:hypothetical protein
MKSAGYARAELAREPRWFSVFWAGVREIPQFVRYAGIGLPLLYKGRVPERLDAVEQELLRRVTPKAWASYPGYQLPSAPAAKQLTR